MDRQKTKSDSLNHTRINGICTKKTKVYLSKPLTYIAEQSDKLHTFGWISAMETVHLVVTFPQ